MKEIRLQPCSLLWPEDPLFPESTAQPYRFKGSADLLPQCVEGGVTMLAPMHLVQVIFLLPLGTSGPLWSLSIQV